MGFLMLTRANDNTKLIVNVDLFEQIEVVPTGNPADPSHSLIRFASDKKLTVIENVQILIQLLAQLDIKTTWRS